jgi:hypothetical protein
MASIVAAWVRRNFRHVVPVFLFPLSGAELDSA